MKRGLEQQAIQIIGRESIEILNQDPAWAEKILPVLIEFVASGQISLTIVHDIMDEEDQEFFDHAKEKGHSTNDLYFWIPSNTEILAILHRLENRPVPEAIMVGITQNEQNNLSSANLRKLFQDLGCGLDEFVIIEDFNLENEDGEKADTVYVFAPKP